MKLLIVDDHAGVRAMIREIAGCAAVEVRESATGESAIAMAQEFSPDVVTMDARMPGLGGIEATRQIRVVCPAAKVLVVSSYNFPAMRAAALQAGACEFIAKDDLTQLQRTFSQFRALRTHNGSGGAATVPHPAKE